MRRKEKAKTVLDRLAKVILVPETELHYSSPFQLLVAVMLSAQCTDKRVNETTPALFERYPTPQSLLGADFEEVFPYIKGISYPANKTRHLIKTAEILVETHGGQVPSDYEALLALPGVGRKTANVVTSIIWQAPRFAVDTHVFRVANRIGLTIAKNPLQSEKQLTETFRDDQIPEAHHYLILHGRYTCVARKPLCGECTLTDICKHFARQAKSKAPAGN
ncbi:MAG TPA: endonuclease III [Bacteroidia bacterium]|jgi:endonuclease-3|nr:endonuclease III [Bacteroidia bacterium]